MIKYGLITPRRECTMNPLVQHLTDVVNDDVRLGIRPLGVALRYLQLQPLIQLMDDMVKAIDDYEGGLLTPNDLVEIVDHNCSQKKIIEAYNQGWNKAMTYGLTKCCEATQEDSIPEPGT